MLGGESYNMKKLRAVYNCLLAFICSIIFFVTYYCGLFMRDYTVTLAVLGGALTSLLMSSKDFSNWTEKSLVYAFIVISLACVFQYTDMHLILARSLDIDCSNVAWGETQLISNSIWFGQGFGSEMIALVITAIATYKESKDIVQ